MSSRNGTTRYEFDPSAAFGERLADLHRAAGEVGRGPEFTGAITEIVVRVEADPYRAGDPVYHLHGLKLTVRVIARSPVVLYYTINEDRHLIWPVAVLSMM